MKNDTKKEERRKKNAWISRVWVVCSSLRGRPATPIDKVENSLKILIHKSGEILVSRVVWHLKSTSKFSTKRSSGFAQHEESHKVLFNNVQKYF